MYRILCFCVIWLVCATAVLPAAIPSNANSVATQTPERSEVQDMNADAKKLPSSDAIQMEDPMPMQKENPSDFKFDPSQGNHQNPLHHKNDHSETQLDESHPRDASSGHPKPTELNSQKTPPAIPGNVAPASLMDQGSSPQPISESALSNVEQGDQDWKTGLLNAVGTNNHPESDKKESQIVPQSNGALDQPVNDAVGSGKQTESTANAALPDDSTGNAKEITPSFSSLKDQNDNKEAGTELQSSVSAPSTTSPTKEVASSKQQEPADAAPSASGHDAETKV